MRQRELLPSEVLCKLFTPSDAVVKIGTMVGSKVETKVPNTSGLGDGNDYELSNSMNKSAKKKVKKGKKVVDPSLLGFSVASNRILMGEIQHVED